MPIEVYMENLIEKIKRLKKEKNAVIIAHNYELPEVQDIADFVGDSLGLARQAANTDADIILFCGVHFMAETASIISQDKKVLIPDLTAGCSLADSITAAELKKWKEENPNAVVVSYINTTAAVKAESDYCCTSSNAVEIVKSIPEEKLILFCPDRFLGKFVMTTTKRKMKIWEGACHVHKKININDFEEKIKENPNADFLIHPECSCSANCTSKSQDNIKVYSTEGMIKHVESSSNKNFVIATETGILHRLKKLHPEKNFIPMNENAICDYMKKITLNNILDALKYEQYEVKVPKTLAEKAKLPIEKMLELSK
jgi:quinolinate synthase